MSKEAAFVDLMLASARAKKHAEPQSRTGSVSEKEVEEALKSIRDKLKRL